MLSGGNSAGYTRVSHRQSHGQKMTSILGLNIMSLPTLHTLGTAEHRMFVVRKYKSSFLDIEPFQSAHDLKLPCFSVQIKYQICKNMKFVQLQCEHHH